MDKLAAKKAELSKIEEHIAELMAQFAEADNKKKDLEMQVKKCEIQLERAQNLIGGLSGEKTRWQEAASELDRSSATVLGDVLLSAGVVAYLGAFTGAYRSECLRRWLNVFQ